MVLYVLVPWSRVWPAAQDKKDHSHGDALQSLDLGLETVYKAGWS